METAGKQNQRADERNPDNTLMVTDLLSDRVGLKLIIGRAGETFVHRLPSHVKRPAGWRTHGFIPFRWKGEGGIDSNDGELDLDSRKKGSETSSGLPDSVERMTKKKQSGTSCICP